MTGRDMKMTSLAPPAVDIGSVQTIRKISLLVTVATIGALFVFSASRWSPAVHQTIEWIGLALIFICISGRSWCSLYIGGRKTSELVMTGPYSVSRNPLYLFSIIGAVGVGAQLGAVSVAILAGVFAWVVHILVVIQEERLLVAEHGEVYQKYLAEVPRFLPRLSLWKNVDILEVRSRAVVTTYFDACFFLVAFPIAELLEYFQNAGAIHVLMRLP
jgi:protein-S-isoprenylcysteine O-methyltransferase Ste14